MIRDRRDSPTVRQGLRLVRPPSYCTGRCAGRLRACAAGVLRVVRGAALSWALCCQLPPIHLHRPPPQGSTDPWPRRRVSIPLAHSFVHSVPCLSCILVLACVPCSSLVLHHSLSFLLLFPLPPLHLLSTSSPQATPSVPSSFLFSTAPFACALNRPPRDLLPLPPSHLGRFAATNASLTTETPPSLDRSRRPFPAHGRATDVLTTPILPSTTLLTIFRQVALF